MEGVLLLLRHEHCRLLNLLFSPQDHPFEYQKHTGCISLWAQRRPRTSMFPSDVLSAGSEQYTYAVSVCALRRSVESSKIVP